MAKNQKLKFTLQSYPRRTGGYVANDDLFPLPKPLNNNKLSGAVRAAFERSLRNKKGNLLSPHLTPHELVKTCLRHLKERSDPILSPSFLSQCNLSEVFEMDAIAHEMQRHRMKIGNFYQFLVIELMKCRFTQVYDGKREGDVEAEIDTLKQVGSYLPFNSLKYREECATLLEKELRKFGLVNTTTGKIDPQEFQNFICRSQEPQNDKEEYDE